MRLLQCLSHVSLFPLGHLEHSIIYLHPSLLPGLRAEALDYHRRAGMPEAMVNDERSVTFMISGSMTQNKNAQVGIVYASSFDTRGSRHCVSFSSFRFDYR
jgi:hypothetical protein